MSVYRKLDTSRRDSARRSRPQADRYSGAVSWRVISASQDRRARRRAGRPRTRRGSRHAGGRTGVPSPECRRTRPAAYRCSGPRRRCGRHRAASGLARRGSRETRPAFPPEGCRTAAASGRSPPGPEGGDHVARAMIREARDDAVGSWAVLRLPVRPTAATSRRARRPERSSALMAATLAAALNGPAKVGDLPRCEAAPSSTMLGA